MQKTHIKFCLVFIMWLFITNCFAESSKLFKRKWYEAKSPNFHIISNTSEKEAKAVAENLELFRHAVSNFLKVKKVDDTPSLIYAMKDIHGMEDEGINTKNIAGFFRQTPYGNIAVADIAGFSGKSSVSNWAKSTILHEYVHYTIGESDWMGFFPLWFNEGIAQFLSTFKTHRNGYDFGALSRRNQTRFRRNPHVPVEQLFNSNRYPGNIKRIREFYFESFKTVFYLYTNPGMMKKALIYINLINKGVPIDQAFQHAFGVSYKHMSVDIKKYYERKPRFDKLTIPYNNYKSPKIEIKPLNEMEVYYSVGILAHDGFGVGSDKTLGYFKSALKLNPKHLDSHIRLANILVDKARFNEASKYIEDGFKLSPNDAKMTEVQGAMYYHQAYIKMIFEKGDWKPLANKALEKFRLTIEKDPNYLKAYFGIVDTYLNLLKNADPAEAIEIADDMLKLIKFKGILAMQGDLYYKNGQKQKALKKFENFCIMTTHEKDDCSMQPQIESIEWDIFHKELPVKSSAQEHKYKDGSIFKGKLQKGKPNGVGEAIHSNGSSYAGGWKDGHFNGKGKFTWSSENWYEGNYANGQTLGAGEIHFSSGEKYIGEFKKDYIFHGQGTFYWENGSKYSGGYKDDKKHGIGKLTFEDGKTIDVEWLQDNLKQTLPDGTIFYGGYKYNEKTKSIKPKGFGYCIKPDNKEPKGCEMENKGG